MRVTSSTFQGEEALKDKASQMLWSLIMNAGDERRNQRKRDFARAPYTSRCKQLIEHTEKDDD